MAAINITEQAAAAAATAQGFEVYKHNITLHLYYNTTINDHTSYTALYIYVQYNITLIERVGD